MKIMYDFSDSAVLLIMTGSMEFLTRNLKKHISRVEETDELLPDNEQREFNLLQSGARISQLLSYYCLSQRR